MSYLLLVLAALLLTYLVRFTVKEIKTHITKEADRIIKEIQFIKFNSINQ